jgi:hypothetical protein
MKIFYPLDVYDAVTALGRAYDGDWFFDFAGDDELEKLYHSAATILHYWKILTALPPGPDAAWDTPVVVAFDSRNIEVGTYPGETALDVIDSIYDELKDASEAGILRTPAKLMWVTDTYKGKSALVVNNLDFVSITIFDGTVPLAIYKAVLGEFTNPKSGESHGGLFSVDEGMIRTLSEKENPEIFSRLATDARNRAFARSLVIGALHIILQMSDRGVPMTVIDAPVKLNKKRRKKGRNEIPPVVYININQRDERNENRGTGTHASPRMHRRRGHWRYFQNGRRTWIESHWINFDPDRAVQPTTYVVRKGD